MANLILAAKRYAEADKSDPFAFSRAMTHLKNGIAQYALKDGSSAFYDAEEAHEIRRLPDGTEYRATIHKNMVRP